MKTKPTIAIVAHDVGGRGGMERHLDELVTRLKQDANVIVVACTINLRDTTGIRLIRIPVLSKPAPVKIVLFSLIASLWLLFLQYDLLHSTGAIVFNKADVSTVHFCHAGYMQATGGARAKHSPSLARKINNWVTTGISLWMERLIYRPGRTRTLVAVSNRVRSELLESFPYKDIQIATIPNGVDVSRFRPRTKLERDELRHKYGLPQTATNILFMGSDWPLKGLDYALHVFNRLAVIHKHLHLIVVGRGDIDYHSQLVSPGFRDRVHFVGPQVNPEEWFGLSDVFLFPSSYETFSLVVHEAAASGLIVLSTQVGGVEELIEEGVNGYFIDRDADAVFEKLNPIIQNVDAFGEVRDQARYKTESITWDSMYNQIYELYNQHLTAMKTALGEVVQ